jgi:hypothetical protein
MVVEDRSGSRLGDDSTRSGRDLALKFGEQIGLLRA